MKVYLRKLTNNDTTRQIETTVEAFTDFFGAPVGSNSIDVTLTAPNSVEDNFTISFAGGSANSLRFSNASTGGKSLSRFLRDNNCSYIADDILKISKINQKNYVEIIGQTDSEYMALLTLIRSKENTAIITDDYYFADSISLIANYVKYEVNKHGLQQEIDDFISQLSSVRDDFLAKFSIQVLKTISSQNLDIKLFGKKEDDSLAYNLSDNPEFNVFGSAKQSNTTQVNWIGSDFIQYLESIDDFIDSNKPFTNIVEYEELWKFMSNLPIDYYSQRLWVKKYLHILYPEIFVSQLNDDTKNDILSSLKIIPADNEIQKVFQLSKLSELTGIPTDFFWRIVKGEIDTPTDTVNFNEIYTTNCSTKNSYPYNRIFFGAPGTGKSYELEKQRSELLKTGGNYERVTFHPDYSYGQFVGTYKPVPVVNNGEEKITYEYVPGPFMRILTKALINSQSSNAFLLLIEEINRANVATVFGEVFQLLDRKDGISEYSITLSEDMKRYLVKEFELHSVQFDITSVTKIKLPDNLFIWCSMNSADQGVFPMDTAFKRRWEFEYFGIDDNQEYVADYSTSYGLNWNQLRKAINELLSSDKFKINEDKLMGPFFVNPKKIAPKDSNIMEGSIFNDVFKNKVLMYLFDDAAKQKRGQLFASDLTRYSQICSKFDSNFNDDGTLKDGIKIENLFDIFQEKSLLLEYYGQIQNGVD